jgi:Co/Zn/Cd efflux system component
MDCASEENIIRMKLDGLEGIASLDFDIPNRKLIILHGGDIDEISKSIQSLNFDSTLLSNEDVSENPRSGETNVQTALLWKVLVINFSFFILELTTGFVSRSMGLIADSMDMLADALVYGMSLLVVRGTVTRKKRIAGVSGYFQLTLAGLGMFEVVRRFLGYEEVPDYRWMILISLLALVANAICLRLLQRSKSEEAHMKASMIFTSNDVIVNLGVIAAGVLVLISESKYPDLVIGAIVFVLVTKGALTILKLSK